MSKIFDALRKAEMARKRPSGSKPGTSASRPRTGETSFLRGLDEDFRRSLLNLRNSIDSEMKGKDARVIMFTSAVAGEGKTMIAGYLARVLAMGESERILLVDCAVNDPQMHSLFGVENDRGILDYLDGTAPIEKVVKVIDEGVLDLVTTGSARGADVTQPLFGSARMRDFMRSAAENYEYVIIDSSAILEAPETPIIGSFATGVVIVVEAGKTKREVVKRAMMMIEKLGGEFIGSILNKKKYYIPEFIYRRV